MAARVEDGLLRLVPHRLLLQLRWPGAAPAGDTGLLAVDDDGRIVGTDRGARAMLGLPAMPVGTTTLEQCFATPPSRLLGLTADTPAVTVPLWSGLQVLVGAVAQRDQAPARWRDAEAQLIRDAMAAAHGNVANAARRLGISRATLYRRLGALKLR
jgi:transcriptional regulator of acetoin/glycerol metabolism